jgi:hypothetical protein
VNIRYEQTDDPETFLTTPEPKSEVILSLPAELRNKIYILALCSPDDIDISRVGYNVTYDLHGHRLRYKHQLDEARASVTTNLLRTSRQLYHEGCSLLYGCNSFRFAHVFPDSPQETMDCPITRCTDWAARCDLNIDLVKHIIIEMNVLCSRTCHDINLGKPWNGAPIDILPLLKLLWAPRASKPSICFQLHGSFRPESHQPPIDIMTLNNVLQQLGGDDVLSLRRFGSLVRDVAIHNDTKRGFIVYRSTTLKECVTRSFDISVQEGRTTFELQPRPHELLDLPEDVLSSIFRHLLVAQDITYDLHKNISVGLDVGLLMVNRRVRRHVAHWHLAGSSFAIVLRSQIIPAPPAMFPPLERRLPQSPKDHTRFRYERDLYRERRNPTRVNPIVAMSDYGNLPDVVIDFHLSHQISLVNVQTGTLELLRVTTCFNSRTHVVFQVSSDGEHGAVLKEHRTTIGEIRLRTFVALADIYFKGEMEILDPRPINIFVNGLGVPVQARLAETPFEPESNIVLRSSSCTLRDLCQIVEDRTRKLDWQGIPAQFQDDYHPMWSDSTISGFLVDLLSLTKDVEGVSHRGMKRLAWNKLSH